MKLVNKLQVIEDVKLLAETEGVSILDACILYCETNNIEIESFAAFIKTMKGGELHLAITADATRLHMLKKAS